MSSYFCNQFLSVINSSPFFLYPSLYCSLFCKIAFSFPECYVYLNQWTPHKPQAFSSRFPVNIFFLYLSVYVTCEVAKTNQSTVVRSKMMTANTDRFKYGTEFHRVSLIALLDVHY